MLPVGKLSNDVVKTVRSRSRGMSLQLLILLVAGGLTTMTGGVVAPVLPEMVRQLSLNPEAAGTLASIHALTSAVFTPIMGVVADRIGKLKVMIPCLILYAIFGVSATFLHAITPLLVVRGLLGAASGGVAAATIGILGGMYEGEARSRILGYATGIMTTSAIFFPIIGGWVGGMQWQFAFYLYGFGLPVAVLAVLYLKENRSKGESLVGGSQTQQLGKILRNGDILNIYLFLGAAAMTVYAVVVYVPFYLDDVLGRSPERNGLVLAIRLVGAALISAFGASRIGMHLGRHRAAAFGFSLMAITVATIPLTTNLPLIFLTSIMFGIGFGIITPNLYDMLAALSPEEFRATVLAIGTGFNSLGQFVSPVILGKVWEYTNLLPSVFYTAGAMAAVASILSLTLEQHIHTQPRSHN